MTNVYSTVPTNWLLAAEQAFAAGGPAINLGAGTLKVGDGFGVVPTAAQIISNGGVLHQVWQGPVNGGAADASNALQININCVIPTVDGSGNEIGPFTVREFAIYDASGNLALVGTTNLPKTVSADGQLTTLQWWACYAAAVANSVAVQPPAGSFPTLGQIQSAVGGLLTANAPLSVTPTLQGNGWTSWLLNVASATLTALGVGRPATDAEFGAGASATSFAWPWPTLQQIKNFLPLTGGILSGGLSIETGARVRALNVASEMALIPTATTVFINACDSNGNNGSSIDFAIRGLTGSATSPALLNSIGLLASNITTSGPVTVPADPAIPMHLATKQYVDNKTAYVTSYSNAYYAGPPVALPLGVLTQIGGLSYASTADVTFTGSSATINTPGVYLIASQATLGVSYSGASIVSASYQIERNGAPIATAIFNTYFPGLAISYPILEPVRVISCAAGDVITLWGIATATLGVSAIWESVSLDIVRIK
jgi:hypothetical protein